MSGSTKSLSPFAARRSKVLAAIARDGRVDAFMVNKVEDVSYLSGFTGNDSILLVGRDWAVLVTDGRYDEQASKECPGIEVFVRKAAMSAAVEENLKPHKVRRLAVQADHLVMRWQEVFAKLMPRLKLVSAKDVVGELRQVKNSEEVAAIRKAVKAAQYAFMSLIGQGRKAFVGRSEREIAAELDYRMRLAGADKPSFDTIVAAGPHGSLPHYRPGDTVVGKDDPVLIDWGAFVGSYCSDLTRVVFPGRIPPKIGEIYQIVEKAQKAGIAAVRAGLSGKRVDLAARSVVEKAGYDKEFVHGLGHGIGRQIHEGPGLGRGVKTRLKAGMVVTVEPGIYLPGVGGVRIEDDVLVTADGHQRLSSLPTALEAMTLK